jgi:Undecaprenyl-phosphate glucose phosphotransferase
MVALALVIYLMYVNGPILQVAGRYLVAIAAAALIYQAISGWMGAYRVITQIGGPTHTARALGAWTLTFAIMLALAFVLKISDSYSRVWAISWFLGTPVSILVLRLTLGQWLTRRTAQGQFAFRTVIVGLSSQARELAEMLCQPNNNELEFLGFIDDRESPSAADRDGSDVLGGIDYLTQLIRAGHVDQVIIALPESSQERFPRLMDQLALTPVRVYVSPFPITQHIRDRNVLPISGVPMVEVLSTPMSGSLRILKGLEDWVLGSLMLLFVAPVMLLISVAIKIDSRGSVFFKQKRQAYNYSLIEVWKFRTMYEHCADPNVVSQTTSNDPRVTRVGRFLRRSSLDELPQLFNILNGTMSLVGPRPHAPETKAEGRKFEVVVDRYAARHRVKPGITGLAQVSGWRGETDTVEKIEQRVKYDLYYIEHWSVWLDIWILGKTLWTVLKGENAY